jgi:hypothetical protein
MSKATVPPLTSTVSTVFDQFLKKLKAEKVLNRKALEALAQSLDSQKFDHETLRQALLTADDPPK